MEDSGEQKGVYVEIDFIMAGERFSGLICRVDEEKSSEIIDSSNSEVFIGGTWESKSKDPKDTLNINTFLTKIDSHFRIPSKVDFAINKIGIVSATDLNKFQICVNSENYGNVTLLKIDNSYSFRIEEIPQRMYFHDLPLIGKYFEEDSFLGLDRFGFAIDHSKFGDLFFKVVVGDYAIDYGNPDESVLPQKSKLSKRYLPAVIHEDKGRYAVKVEHAINDSIHWMDVDKTFGPVRIVRLGIGYNEGIIAVAGDIDIKIACLTFYLVGLSIAIPFGKDSADREVSVNIDGLGINFSSGKFSIVGEVLKDGENSYSGLISVRIMKYGLTIIGTYKETKDENDNTHVYLFAFGALHMVLGGPPCFVVTGLSVGFGINKKIVFPEVGKIKDFPLIQAAMGNWNETNPSKALQAMSKYITDLDGEVMDALGITFNTFQMIDTCLIGLICFGNENQIALLGQSNLKLPTGIDFPFVNLGMGIIAAYNIDQGILEINGAISEGSYVFAKDCKLAGGFAWYMWFKGDNKGDFVLTVGGYHKDFIRPNHYPLVNRVGVNWIIIKNELTLQGDAYMALTPSCVMAGGALNITFVWKSLKAWVRFRADMIISWLPFCYDVNVDASIGASYTFHFFGKRTVTLETNVKLHIWGPDFALQLYVKWYIISFTIEYIPGTGTVKNYKCWNDFSRDAIGIDLTQNNMLEDNNKTYVEAQISNANIVGKKYIVNNGSPMIELSSKIPVKQLYYGNKKIDETSTPLGVLPMGTETAYDHKVTIEITSENGSVIDYNSLIIEVEKTGVPRSLWGTGTEPVSYAAVSKDVITAASISFKEREIPDSARKYKMNYLAEPQYIKNVNNPKHLIENESVDSNSRMSSDYSEEKESIQKVKESCKCFCFGEDWKDFLDEMDVEMLANKPEEYFIGNLMIKRIGEKGEWK